MDIFHHILDKPLIYLYLFLLLSFHHINNNNQSLYLSFNIGLSRASCIFSLSSFFCFILSDAFSFEHLCSFSVFCFFICHNFLGGANHDFFYCPIHDFSNLDISMNGKETPLFLFLDGAFPHLINSIFIRLHSTI